MKLHFETHNQCVAYLIENFYSDDFINNHTRKELAYILSIIEKHTLKDSPYAFRSMCKKRMCEHIDFYLKIHIPYINRVKNIMNKERK